MSNSHKSFLVVDSQGGAQGFSPEEALSSQISNWKGWHCSAGVDNLHITSDGNVFTATCAVAGFLGNVYSNNVRLPEKWITCTKEVCVCGSDMQLRKAKFQEDIKKTYENPPDARGTINMNEARWVAPFHFKHHQDVPKTITWDLGRRCNFSCSYCPPFTSNHHESHKSWESLKLATDFIHKYFAHGKKIKWIFTGGEPTLNPSYKDLVKYVTGLGHITHTQSNGSRPPEYFAEIISMGCLGLSYHFEGVNKKHFISVCQSVIDRKKQELNVSDWWFGVRIMVPPGQLEEALNIRNEIMTIPLFEKLGHLNFSAVYEPLNQEQLLTYSQFELQKLKEL